MDPRLDVEASSCPATGEADSLSGGGSESDVRDGGIIGDEPVTFMAINPRTA